MRIVILASAREDLAEGFRFYEDQGEGLGSYFLESLYSDIASLRLFAGIHRKVFGFHRLLSKRFPYAVYYAMEGESIAVKAVLNCRQDPAWIRKQVQE